MQLDLVIRNGKRETILNFDAESIRKDYLLDCLEMIKKYLEQYNEEENVHPK